MLYPRYSSSSWYNCAKQSPTMYMYIVSIVHIHPYPSGITWYHCMNKSHPEPKVFSTKASLPAPLDMALACWCNTSWLKWFKCSWTWHGGSKGNFGMIQVIPEMVTFITTGCAFHFWALWSLHESKELSKRFKSTSCKTNTWHGTHFSSRIFRLIRSFQRSPECGPPPLPWLQAKL